MIRAIIPALFTRSGSKSTLCHKLVITEYFDIRKLLLYKLLLYNDYNKIITKYTATGKKMPNYIIL